MGDHAQGSVGMLHEIGVRPSYARIDVRGGREFLVFVLPESTDAPPVCAGVERSSIQTVRAARPPSAGLGPRHRLFRTSEIEAETDELKQDAMRALPVVMQMHDAALKPGAHPDRVRPGGFGATVSFVQKALKQEGCRRTGEKYAAKVIACWVENGWALDSGNVDFLQPHPSTVESYSQKQGFSQRREQNPDEESRIWMRVFICPLVPQPAEGGGVKPLSQPSLVPITFWTTAKELESRFRRVNTACLSALAVAQAQIAKPKSLSEVSRGSVQAAYAMCGPP